MKNEIPQLFIDRIKRILSNEHYQQCCDSFYQPKMTSFRVNTLKTTKNHVESELKSLNIPYTTVKELPNTYTIEAQHRRKLTESELPTEGMIYIQNPASMLAVAALNPQPGEEILDLTAAPGGKTLMIADLMKNQGRIAAVEAVKTRFFKLKNNLKTHGVTIADCYLKDGITIGKKVPNRFDKALLDAPCSSESRFHVGNPKSYQYWNEKKIKQMVKKQKKLILSAVQALKTNGVLVYCTCSFAPEENEAVIQYLLDKEPTIEILPLELLIKNKQNGITEWDGHSFSASLSHAVRIIPNSLWNGMFICKLLKRK